MTPISASQYEITSALLDEAESKLRLALRPGSNLDPSTKDALKDAIEAVLRAHSCLADQPVSSTP